MNTKTKKIVGIGLFTAIVIALQLLGGAIRFGVFSISLVLIPIVVGAAVYGWKAGGWLGFVFGLAVLLSGDAGAFLAVNVPGTILVVLLKGTFCGLGAGAVYLALCGINKWLAVICAAIVCPIINTGIFLIGCYTFFLPTVTEWGKAVGYENVGAYLIFGMVGINFLLEIGINLLLAPVITRLIRIGQH